MKEKSLTDGIIDMVNFKDGIPHCECHDIGYGSKKGAKTCEDDNLEDQDGG